LKPLEELLEEFHYVDDVELGDFVGEQ